MLHVSLESCEAALQNGDEMRRAISSKLPAKIDIGPVYNVDPQRRGAFAGQVQLHALHPKHALHVAPLPTSAPVGAAGRRWPGACKCISHTADTAAVHCRAQICKGLG